MQDPKRIKTRCYKATINVNTLDTDHLPVWTELHHVDQLVNCWVYFSCAVADYHWIYHFLFSDLLKCTNEPNVSIPQLANLLIERTQNGNWVVVYKSLVTIHNLMNYGNEVCIHMYVNY